MIEEQIKNLIEPSIEQDGFEVVRVMIMGDRHKVLQIMLDRIDQKPITIEDCSKATKTISALLDVEDLVDGKYILEVSSPGVDRPLTRLKDFERFKGYKAKIELKIAISNRRRFQGEILEVNDHQIAIKVEDEELTFSFDDIYKSKLIMDDNLFMKNNDKSKEKENA